jgi:hypothetical protein
MSAMSSFAAGMFCQPGKSDSDFSASCRYVDRSGSKWQIANGKPFTVHEINLSELLQGCQRPIYVSCVLSYYDGWYNEVMTEPISIRDGMITLAERPGLGTALRQEVLNRPDAHLEYSDEHHRIDMSKG